MHTFEGSAPQAPPATAGAPKLMVKSLPDFKARHHPSQWDLVDTSDDPTKTRWEWLPVLRMHRLVPGVDGVLTDNNGNIIERSVRAREAANRTNGWIYISEEVAGRYRKEFPARVCRDGRPHFTWAWQSYRQVPGMSPQCVPDTQAEYTFRRGLIGKTIDGVALLPTAYVKRAALNACGRRIADLQRMKSTLAVERDLARQQELHAALEATELPVGPVAAPPALVARDSTPDAEAEAETKPPAKKPRGRRKKAATKDDGAASSAGDEEEGGDA